MKLLLKLFFGLVTFVILVMLIMFIFRICPPPGPWPMPPWCGGAGPGTSFIGGGSNPTSGATGQSSGRFTPLKPGTGAEFLRKPVFLSTDVIDIMLPGNTFLDKMQPAGIHWGYIAGMKSMVKPHMFLLNSKNIHYIGASITPMHPIDDSVKMPEAAAVDLQGKMITVQKPGMSGYRADDPWMNLLDPRWQEYLLNTCKKLIDNGVEGVVVDESTFNREVIFRKGGTFDKYSMEGFTAYLKNKYNTEQLKSKYKITDINSFDFKNYIIANKLEGTWNKAEYPPIPITYEFAQFQLVESSRIWREMSAQLKKYAREKYNREFLFSMSASPQFAIHFMPTDFQDFLTGEQFYFMNGSEMPKGAVLVKLAESMSPRMALYVEVSHDRGTIPAKTKNLFKYIFADVYSADGRMITNGDKILTMRNRFNYVDAISFDTAEAGKYTKYAMAHPEFYGLLEQAKVGLIHSLASRKGGDITPVAQNRRSNDSMTKGIVQMLLNLNVPTGIILSGDEELVVRDVTLQDLSPYEVVIVPDVFMCSDNESKALLDYVSKGGKVLAFGRFGTHNKRGELVNRSELAGVSGEGEHKIGKGVWRTVNEDLGTQYMFDKNWKARIPTEQNQAAVTLGKFKSLLTSYYAPEVESTAPVTVNIRRYLDKERMVLHLINYDYNQVEDEFKTAGPFEVSVTLPEGKKVSLAEFHDFETGQKTALSPAIQGNKISFKIPSLYCYGVLEIKF
ncbi:MAG: beta-galactosidase trimerization domain-containing protein [Peptococcaceae bacterium]|jgi:hypothetical protein|nr:beta-galactosidase trimerization domain-containing protein [Peptococcaceae bacterium]MDH7524972.1 beta-galactosidase trimerization domain-containing protein [Peptococcaceae bacterium]